MAMQRLTGLLSWLLLNILLLVTGVSGEDLTVYSSVGDAANLPCNHNHRYLDCSSIMWGSSNPELRTTIELVTDGKVRDKNQEKSGKLRMESNCSLHINNFTTADVGEYYCRLYKKEENMDFTDAIIYLSLLSISASSPVTELKIGSTVTLRCELHSHRPCGKSISVTWVSETGAPLQGDRYNVSGFKCSSTLTLTLQRSDRNLKCQLSEEQMLKASRSYTITFSGDMTIWIVSGVTICVAVLIVILIIVCKRKIVRREKTFKQVSGSHTVTDQEKEQGGDSVTYAVVNTSAAGKRKSDGETAETQTEYATIKTSHRTDDSAN
ncbi:hypothetical protein SKAU_G00338420 [Synaphobranchus kaupii]|uniref:Ig-like domain-containing protein n=1 Tax=Synaphobranchus kaupii TaxID=118154 RepID=A0A9Q1IJ70_SYNKA|nr:hypothetical protein SKAU_G00338420 [Synaphobranchus kaupii]